MYRNEEMKDKSKSLYKAPRAELLSFVKPLSLMAHFSGGGGTGQDWEFSDAWWDLEDDRLFSTDDWGGFGDLGNDTD